jgi:hypothetical protein
MRVKSFLVKDSSEWPHKVFFELLDSTEEKGDIDIYLISIDLSQLRLRSRN